MLLALVLFVVEVRVVEVDVVEEVVAVLLPLTVRVDFAAAAAAAAAEVVVV